MSSVRFPRPLVAAVAFLMIVPALLAPLPPIVDLPQQLAQIRLLEEVGSSTDSPYRVAWAAPNKLAYPLLALALSIGGPEHGPAIALALCGGALAAAILVLGLRLRRPPEQAALATLLVPTGIYYGGFLSFLVGGAAFAAWLVHLDDPEARSSPWRWLKQLVLGLALYYGHLLWLGAALLAALVPGPRARGARARLEAVAVLTPFLLAGLLWFAASGRAGSGEPANYVESPLQRLIHADQWGRWLFHGLRGPWESALLAALVAWSLFCLLRPRPGSEPSRWLGRLALVFLLLGLLLPVSMGYTALLAHRWLPWAAICALLALPAPDLGRRASIAIPFALLVAHGAVTAHAWYGYDREELRGLRESLAAVPDGSRLLGLDFDRTSPRFRLAPYSHMAAYAQLDRRIRLGYTFASTPTSLVVYRNPNHRDPWTRGLDHLPRLLAPGDLDHFDFLLVHGRSEVQERVARLSGRLRAVAGETPWRLFAVRPAAAGREGALE